ncbi:MAG: hypothetical protein M1831_005206 [Alyxoria varia]|nr:MAG: hypothetical protein M1831_005206 [Alyxoria varia]
METAKRTMSFINDSLVQAPQYGTQLVPSFNTTTIPKTPEIPSKPFWAIFDYVFQSTAGYQATDFKFTAGSTPIATFKETATMLVAYYTVVFGGRELMKSRSAFKLSEINKIHNFILTAVSGILLVLHLEQLVPMLKNHGLFYGICDSGAWTSQMETLYYLNYITKYIELADTVFLVLKKKPLTFLHTYHHGATALLCYTQLVGHTPVSWVPITLNLSVHVVMYWYYFQAARGIKVAWKEWITIFQIAQFILDLGFIYFAFYNYYASAYIPDLPHIGTCSGEPVAAWTGCVILSSYLLLFLSFYASTYRKPVPKRKRGTSKSAGHIHAEVAMEDMQKLKVPDAEKVEQVVHDAAGEMGKQLDKCIPDAMALPN